MLLPPLRHPQHVTQSGTHLLYLRTPFPFVLLGFHPFVPLLLFFSYSPIFLLLCKKMNRTRAYFSAGLHTLYYGWAASLDAHVWEGFSMGKET